jgi:hypothetical protein
VSRRVICGVSRIGPASRTTGCSWVIRSRATTTRRGSGSARDASATRPTSDRGSGDDDHGHRDCPADRQRLHGRRRAPLCASGQLLVMWPVRRPRRMDRVRDVRDVLDGGERRRPVRSVHGSGDRMTNRPKAIGTRFESAIAGGLVLSGAFPHAERAALAGSKDCGDITGTPGLAWETKGGQAAKTASVGQIVAWMIETEQERANRGADIGILVVQRNGVSGRLPERWGEHRAFVPDWAWAKLHGADPGLTCSAPGALVEVLLSHLVEQLRFAGYGSPLPSDDFADGDAQPAAVEPMREGAA